MSETALSCLYRGSVKSALALYWQRWCRLYRGSLKAALTLSRQRWCRLSTVSGNAGAMLGASVFHFRWKRHHTVHTNKRKKELTENRNLHFLQQIKNRNDKLPFFAAKWKRKYVFLGQQTINGNQQLLFKQTCPSMDLDSIYYWQHINSRVTII